MTVDRSLPFGCIFTNRYTPIDGFSHRKAIHRPSGEYDPASAEQTVGRVGWLRSVLGRLFSRPA